MNEKRRVCRAAGIRFPSIPFRSSGDDIYLSNDRLVGEVNEVKWRLMRSVLSAQSSESCWKKRPGLWRLGNGPRRRGEASTSSPVSYRLIGVGISARQLLAMLNRAFIRCFTACSPNLIASKSRLKSSSCGQGLSTKLPMRATRDHVTVHRLTPM